MEINFLITGSTTLIMRFGFDFGATQDFPLRITLPNALGRDSSLVFAKLVGGGFPKARSWQIAPSSRKTSNFFP
jgi:hypothetical protein